jgi:hypothetical protein
MCTKVKNGRGQLYRIIMDFSSGAGPAGWRTAQESVYVVNATENPLPPNGDQIWIYPDFDLLKL